ncbi:MAG: SufD family Fe-S cluster assembly protein [Eubacterium sp.]|nr:SufD family Fe-S cluster assembly protein [Eubacterium sp.]
MTENVIRVNELPAMTWNWLKMNNLQFEKGSGFGAGNIEADIPSEIKSGELSDADKQTLMDAETGMGKEMSALVQESGSVQAEASVELMIDKGVKASAPVRLKFRTLGKEAAASCLAVAEEDSEMMIISDMTEISDGSRRSGVETRILVKDRAKVKLVEIYKGEAESEYFSNIGAVVGEKAEFSLVQLFLGGKKVSAGCAVALKGDKSVYNEKTAYEAPADARFDFNYVTRHIGKDTESNVHAGGVLHENAEKTMRQTIDFICGCSGSKGAEREEVLLMDEDLVNKTIPLILCAEEDVEGEHGASIGKLSEEVLFYLRARGLSDEAIYSLMASGRLMSVVNEIGDEQTEKMATELIMGESLEENVE